MLAALKMTHDLCLKETGASQDNLQKCSEKHIPDEPSSKCYLDCMVKHIKAALEMKTIKIQGVDHTLTDEIMEMISTAREACGIVGKTINTILMIIWGLAI